jgi:hypothetical protein
MKGSPDCDVQEAALDADRELGAPLDRRQFLASVTLVTGGIAASCVVKWSPVRAADVAQPNVLLSDWTIDDMWGVYPRYAEPIGYGRSSREGFAATGSIDALFHA